MGRPCEGPPTAPATLAWAPVGQAGALAVKVKCTKASVLLSRQLQATEVKVNQHKNHGLSS